MRKMLAASALVLLAAGSAGAQEQIVNGGFEAGTFAGWNVANQSGGSGDFFVATGNTTPLNGFGTNGPRSGRYYAVTDQGGPGAHEIWQSFSISGAVSSAIFRFSIADLNQALTTYNGGNLDFTTVPNQHVRVDLFFGAYSPFSTASIQNFFTGATTELGGTTYGDYNFDVTSLINSTGAGTYTVRFAEVDNQLFHNYSVDDVSLATTATPEPASMTLLATGLLGIGIGARRRRRTA